MKIVPLPHREFVLLVARVRAQQEQPVFAGGGKELRQARRARRRSRRAARRAEKRVELEQETRANRKRRKQAQQALPSRQRKQRQKERASSAPASQEWERAWEPLDGGARSTARGGMQRPGMPGGRSFPAPRRAQRSRGFEDELDEGFDEGFEDEGFDEGFEDEGFDEGFEDEGFEDDLDEGGMEAAGLRDLWGEKVPLGENLTLRARAGYRAAVVPWKPGLYLVAEVPEEVAREEQQRAKMGFAPVVAPLIIKAVANRLMNRPAAPAAPPAPEVKQGTIIVPVVSGSPAATRPVSRRYTELGWADEQSLAEIGCEGCGGRCGQKRRGRR